jgi:aerobic-type carbon monoxide dehydrogenase small subunit (CoxS/CutS family)
MKDMLTLTVNGCQYEFPPLPGETLADLLRKRLHLTGTKVGCNEAECGACTVIVDGDPVLSCIYPAERADGRKILTIEGLAEEGKLHPLQEAFIEHGAVQCGFCTPGQIMVAYALLQRNPTPTSAEIRQALKDTLCRCGGYPSIESAVDAAARALYNHTPVETPKIEPSIHAHKVIGRSVNRPDVEGKVTGACSLLLSNVPGYRMPLFRVSIPTRQWLYPEYLPCLQLRIFPGNIITGL